MRHKHIRPLRRTAARVAAALAASALVAGAVPAHAQQPALPAPLFAGGEVEHYLRYLQTTGEVQAYPWGLRGFGLDEARRLAPPEAEHPWTRRLGSSAGDSTRRSVRLLPVTARSWYNTGFPFATNDGAVWAGRGITAAAQAGVAMRVGPLSAVIAPIVFLAENREFELRDNGYTGDLAFAPALDATSIDLPQRFGDDAYGRIDPGESSIRLDAGPVALAVSTANQVWGPGTEYPLVLGNAGPGFLHGFAGTSRPLNVGIGHVHARLVYGRLAQSDYTFIRTGAARNRFMSGIVASVQPRVVPGLEIGGTRFFHTPWPDGGLTAGNFRQPFQGILKEALQLDSLGDPADNSSNQIASLFFRWSLRPAGFEAYGEFAREDHNYDLRDLTLEPDQHSAYMFGLRRAWRPSADRLVAVRGEVMDARVTRLARVRPQGTFYTHGGTPQGHTQRGQPLGGRAVNGGAAATLAVDVYNPRGRWTARWMREERGASGAGWHGLPENPDARVWVAHALGVESVFAVGKVDLRLGATGVVELNRYLQERDVYNLNTEVGIEWRP